MNSKVADLSQRLNNAIDKNYNVTNMEEFIAVIEALEGTTVTKEVLETTRMAKYINEVRRRTRFVPLAKRVKLLLKKWRSIVLPVGSDNSSSNVVAMSNENAASAQSKQQQQQPPQRYPLSQSTSPIGAMTFSSNSAPSTATSATRSANLNVHNYNMKRLENVEVPSRAGFSTSTVPKECGKQPTSFANLIPDLKNKSISTTESNYARVSTARRKTVEPINHFYDKTPLSSTIEVGEKFRRKNAALVEPIVIDIQDSNSGSDVISATELTQPMPLVSKKSIGGASVKPKKPKKEKKRKDRDSQNDKSPLLMQHFNNSAVADPIPQPHVHPIHITSDDIFSISNSSINSMFAGEPTLKTSSNDTLKTRRALPKPIAGAATAPVAPADLSFAGKFQPQRNSNSSSTVPTGFGNSTDFLPAIDIDRSQVDFGIAKQPTDQHFVNSNESSSCSRASQFEPAGVIVDEVRLQQPRVPRADLAGTPSKPAASVAVVPSEADAHSSSANAANPEQKIPKKRGRKKGSKGVDSVIAKEASLSSQMLISSLGAGAKKVKTTKELYAEMQNRKLKTHAAHTALWGAAPSQLPSHTETSCSDSSDVFAKNTSTTLTNGPTSVNLLTAIDETSSDSSRPSVASGKRTRAISVESNSNSQLAASKARSSATAATQPDAVAAIEQQLHEFLKELPAAPSLREIEVECTADLIPCSCTITEVLPEQLSVAVTATDQVEDEEHEAPQVAATAGTTSHEQLQLPQNRHKTNLEESTLAEPPRPHLKSIFDLDYSEENDPLKTLYADVYAGAAEQQTDTATSWQASAMKVAVVEAQPIEEHTPAIPTVTVTAPSPASVPFAQLPSYPTFKVEEDPACAAKTRFELQTQKITEFHIKALHNCYIPNINGNWDHTNETNTKLLTADRSAAARVFVNVVPKYGLYEEDYIPKDLSKVSFTKNFKPKKRTAEMDALVDVPFLGSARLAFLRKSRVRRKDKHKKIKHEEDSANLLNENEKTVEADQLDELNPPNHCTEESLINSNAVNSYLNTELIADAGNNNELLKDISIDIADAMTNFQYIPGDALKSATPPSQHLLTTVDNHAYKLDNPSTNNGDDFVLSMVTDAATAKHLNSSATEGEMDDNASSRYSISSHCSKSSLKDIQHSINLKLRRRTNNSRQRQRNKSDVETDEEAPPKKRIRRIKIAINGDIATQRQISIGSSNNNSSDYGNSDEDEDATDNSSAYEEHDLYTVINDGQTAGGDSDEEYGELEDTDVDGDADGEDDDDEDYTGEYHEVVTRDISAPSTNNNHIVLTIKKTPSKTNSPSNSVAAISPILAGVKKQAHEKLTVSPKQASQSASASDPASATETVSAAVVAPSPNALSAVHEHEQEQEQEHEQEHELVPEHEHKLDSPQDFELTSANVNSSTLPFAEPPGFVLDRRRYRMRRLRRRRKPIQPFRFPEDAPTAAASADTRLLKRKTHRRLFFDDELHVRVDHNRRDRLLNISSCSSSCGERSVYEPISSEDDGKVVDAPASIHSPPINKSPVTISSSESDGSEGGDDDGAATSSSTEATNSQNEATPSVRNQCDQPAQAAYSELPAENNGLLLSFNHIYQTTDQMMLGYDDTDSNGPDQVYKAAQQQQTALKQQLPNENCDDYNNPYNNNNNCNLIKFDKASLELNYMKKNGRDQQQQKQATTTQIDQAYPTSSSSTELVPHKEYQTGLRAVDEDVHDEQGNNCARVQQFKEWHQMLRLRSYNDELLTVLPYVVLDF